MAYAMSEPSVLPIVAKITTIQKFHGAPVSGSIWRRVRDEEPGVREDQLGGERDHRRLDRHRDHDAEVPEGAVQVVQERDDEIVDELEHADLGDGASDVLAAARRTGGPEDSRLSSAGG